MKRKNIVVIESETAPDDKYAIWKNGNEVKQVIGDEWTHCADLSEYSDVDGMIYQNSTITKFPDNWRFAPRTGNNCRGLFKGCYYLTSLDLNSLIISQKTTSTSGMFYGCSNLKTITFGNIDDDNNSDMNGMFQECRSLSSINLHNFKCKNVTNMSSLFAFCQSLTSLDLSSFDTSKVTVMNYMFQACTKLTSLDLSSFNTSNVMYMFDAFERCKSLVSLNLSNSDMSNVRNVSEIFDSCSKLQTITKGSFKNLKVSLDLSDCVVLSKQSVVDLFDSIGTANSGATITLASAVYSQLSEDEIKVATDKGWTVASS